MRPPRLPQAENGWGFANGRYGENSRLFPNEMSRREAFCSTEMDGSTQCVCRVGLYEDREPDQERVWKSAGNLVGESAGSLIGESTRAILSGDVTADVFCHVSLPSPIFFNELFQCCYREKTNCRKRRWQNS